MARMRMQPAVDLCKALGIDPVNVKRIYLDWEPGETCDIIVTIANHEGLLETVKRYKWVEDSNITPNVV